MKHFCQSLICMLFFVYSHAQTTPNARKWVDSVYKTLSPEQRIAQLMVVRLSSGNAAKTQATFYTKEVEAAIQQYNIGGICLFQGGPVKQANILNYLQSIAKTPLLICIDGETGVGMRLDSVDALPRQMMLGAIQNPQLIFDYGRVVGEQCKRMGIQVNYAPVVDINNNPANPVINDRSFGENKYIVAKYGIQYVRGMQSVGVMGCAKHFPGHGDVSVDSHLDLPVIPKSRQQLDSLELYPFREIFKAGVGSVMVAHLYIPAIDNTANRATSLSYKNVTTLLRKDLKYTGLTFTDALEMKGVSKFFPDGEASVQSLIAGNDMLCLPGDIPGAISKTLEAIKKRKLKWKDIEARVKRVLYAKFEYGLSDRPFIQTAGLTADLNKDIHRTWQQVAQESITLLRNDQPLLFPLMPMAKKKVAYVATGISQDNSLAERLRKDYNAHVFYLEFNQSKEKADALLALLRNRYDLVVLGMHGLSRFPGNNFGLTPVVTDFMQQLDQQQPTVTFVFGNPYAIKQVCSNKTIIACYEDNPYTQEAAADLLNGQFVPSGKLPVTVCDAFPYGSGLSGNRFLPNATPASMGFQEDSLEKINAIVENAIQEKAIPGAVVLVAKDGKIIFEKAYGHFTYEGKNNVYPQTIYDLASVTKVMATTLSVMKLYDEGKLDLKKPIGQYLSWLKGSDKENILVEDLLLHQAGLKSFISFYKEVSDSMKGNTVSGAYFTNRVDSSFSVRVANNLFMRKDWVDSMYRRIATSSLGEPNKYVYSDNDFILLGKIVESISQLSLDQYVKKTFYSPLQLQSIGFQPRKRFDLDRIAPTEDEKIFRAQLIWGDVHDPGAAMFGGVAGHAGLFSNAYDLAVLAQLLLNQGTIDGQSFFKPETVAKFTAYNSAISRRGLGFDKPEKDNVTRKEPYPAKYVSDQTYGHTGFTGTCVWIDPVHQLTYIFLSNRVHPSGSNKFLQMNVRPRVHDQIYRSFQNGSKSNP